MFNTAPRPGENGQKGSVFNRGVALLGGAAGIVAAILLTPPIFGVIRAPLLAYLSDAWPSPLARALVWVTAGCVAIAIYVAVKLAIVLGAVFGAAALAARGFPGVR